MSERLPPWELALWGVGLLGVIVIFGVEVVRASCRTGVPDIDRLGLQFAEQGWRVYPLSPRSAVRFAQALAALCNNESGGAPAPVVGDTTAAGGPSVGPLQVYRQTAKDLGLWSPPDDGSDERDAYAALALDESWCIWAGAEVLRDKLRQAAGAYPDAIRRYNGSNADAYRYSDKALAFANSHGWNLAA
jgi:hypothetical protein